MSKVSGSVVINAPIEKVFEYTASPANGPVFIPNLNENSNISVSPTQVGQKWDWRFNMGGVDLRGSAEVTEVEPSKKWSLKSSGGGESSWTYTFETVDGGTKVGLDIDYTIPEGVLGKMSAPVIEKINQQNAEQGLQHLKTILES